MSAAQALDFHKPLKPGRGVAAVHNLIRAYVPHLERDRYFKPDLNRVRELVQFF